MSPLDAAQQALATLGAGLGVTGVRSGSLWLQVGGAQVTVEPLASGALCAHAAVPDTEVASGGRELLARLLSGNAPRARPHGQVNALDPVDGTHVVYRRFEAPGSQEPNRLLGEVIRFASGIAEARDPVSAAAGEEAEESFRAAWKAFAALAALSSTPEEGLGPFLLEMEDAPPVTVQFEPRHGTLLLTSSVAIAPFACEDDEVALRKLLELQLLGEATAGAVLALDDATGDLIAWKRFATRGLFGDSLRAEIEALAATANLAIDVAGLGELFAPAPRG